MPTFYEYPIVKYVFGLIKKCVEHDDFELLSLKLNDNELLFYSNGKFCYILDGKLRVLIEHNYFTYYLENGNSITHDVNNDIIIFSSRDLVVKCMASEIKVLEVKLYGYNIPPSDQPIVRNFISSFDHLN
jgi:hypothetical protein